MSVFLEIEINISFLLINYFVGAVGALETGVSIGHLGIKELISKVSRILP